MTAGAWTSRPPRRLTAVGVIGSLLLGGCVVGPNFHPARPDTPAAWLAARSAPAPASAVTVGEPADPAWWKSFDDPELSSLIARALAANLDARQAVLRIEEAREQRRMAAAAAWPSIDANGSYAKTRISERTATTSLLGALGGLGVSGESGPPGGVAAALPGLENPFDQYQAGLSGAWEIDLFGRVRRQVEAADATTEAAAWDRRAVQVSLMSDVAAVYIDLRDAQGRLRVLSDTVGTAGAVLRLAAEARRSDLGGDVDVAAATSALASAKAALPPVEAELTIDENQLALLLAAKPGALDSELADPRAVPPLPPSVPAGVPAELARRRPDIREAEARLHAAVARQGVAVADLYPRVVINAAAGTEAISPAALGDWAARYFAVGPTLDLPVFDAGLRRANVRIADIRSREAATAYAQAVLGALHDVEDAIAAYGQEQARRRNLAAAAEQNRTALTLVERRYRGGVASFRDVLEAQAQVQSAQLALVASAGAAATDLVSLYKALGGGWESADASPAPRPDR